MYKLFPQKSIRICLGRSASTSFSNTDIYDILSTHLGYDHDTIRRIIQSQIDITRISEQRIVSNCKILQEFGVHTHETAQLSACLKLSSVIVKNRILLLEEVGVKNITLQYINRFPVSIHKSIKTFKRYSNMPPDTDIVQNICDSIGVRPNVCNITKLESHIQLSNLYFTMMVYYKSFYLNLYHKSLTNNHHMKFISFRQFAKLISILQNRLQFSKEFLRKHPYLLNLCPDMVEKFFHNFENLSINNMNIYQIVRKYPRILFSDGDNIKEILKVCEDKNIETKSMTNSLYILTMKKKVFLERYNTLEKTPELKVWLQHPKAFYMIIMYRMVMTRVEYLCSLNRLQSTNIQKIIASNKIFKRFVEGRIYHTSTRQDLLYLLHKELGKSNIDLVNYIMRHPHWKCVTAFSIYTMLTYLKQIYTVEDICQNIHIVLYPKDVVSKMLEMIYAKYNAKMGYNFSPSQYLALCLYMLEKQHHFTGDAIWYVMYDDPDAGDALQTSANVDNINCEGFVPDVNISAIRETAWIEQ
ncbi:transcription termination factor 5, mitochondrial [Hylaeus anthracinus]|uniref:transcription termination factor 5, mitochondrial n=1 Tax=Hylaeus anthracinus TaxID=313031 RepID=UPI0023B8E618|nr:transcription termination factor 5, mitochondrial [Hylaeus anthracinus]